MIDWIDRPFCLRAIIAILLALALQPLAALAHEGLPRIELNSAQTTSGAELEVRGVNIAAELPIALSLIGDGAEYPLGTVVGDGHGDFVMGVKLPAEALAGAYVVRAFGANRVLVSARLTLIGVAAEAGGQQRDRSEPLLAALPQSNSVGQPQPIAQAAQSQAPIARAAVTPSAATAPMLFAIGGLAAVGLAVLASWWSRRAGKPGERHGNAPAQH